MAPRWDGYNLYSYARLRAVPALAIGLLLDGARASLCGGAHRAGALARDDLTICCIHSRESDEQLDEPVTS